MPTQEMKPETDKDQLVDFEVPPIFSAAHKGELLQVEKLIGEGAEVNCEFCGQTPLWAAALEGHEKVISLLLHHGANVNKVCKTTSPLWVAVQNNHLPCVDLLIAMNTDLNLASYQGTTPLLKAIWMGYLSVATALIDAGANVNIANNMGNTPLSIAHQKDFVSLAHQLSQKSLLPDISQGWLLKQFFKFLDIMYQHNPNEYHYHTIANLKTEIQYGLCLGFSHFWGLQRQIDNGTFFDQAEYISKWDGTPETLLNNEKLIKLFHSVMNSAIALQGRSLSVLMGMNQRKAGKLLDLISNKEDVLYQPLFEFGFLFKRDELGFFLDAIALEGMNVILSGIDHAISFQKSGQDDYTLYDSKCGQRPEKSTLKQLIRKVLAIFTLDSNANTVGFSVAIYGDYRSIHTQFYEKFKIEYRNLMIKQRIADQELNLTDKTNTTALTYAASAGDNETVFRLIDSGADINPPNGAVAALLFTTINGNAGIARQLVDAGANINYSYDDIFPLYNAAAFGHKDLVDVLILKGAEVDKINSEGVTALMLASTGHFDIVQSLVTAHANINIVSSTGYSALSYASEAGSADIVNYLILNGAELKLFPHALESAIKFGHLNVIRILMEHENGMDLTEALPCGVLPLDASKLVFYDHIVKYIEDSLEKKRPVSTQDASLIMTMDKESNIIVMEVDKLDTVNSDVRFAISYLESRRDELLEKVPLITKDAKNLHFIQEAIISLNSGGNSTKEQIKHILYDGRNIWKRRHSTFCQQIIIPLIKTLDALPGENIVIDSHKKYSTQRMFANTDTKKESIDAESGTKVPEITTGFEIWV